MTTESHAAQRQGRRSLSSFFLPLVLLLFIGSLAATEYSKNIAHYRKHGAVLLNDATITPGLVRSVSRTSVCSGGSTKQYRKTTQAMKDQVYAEYGVERNKGICTGGCEVDHLVPLEVGGADDVRNLWAQPSQPKPGFHEKDKLENKLHEMVCAEQIDLEQAQKEISEDWYAAYLKYIGGN